MEEALTNIANIREWLVTKKPWSDVFALSEAHVKLSVYNAEIGANLGKLHYTSSSTRIGAYKAARASKMTQGDAEIAGDEAALKAREQHETAKFVYESTKNLVTALQNRVNTVRDEMKGQL